MMHNRRRGYKDKLGLNPSPDLAFFVYQAEDFIF